MLRGNPRTFSYRSVSDETASGGRSRFSKLIGRETAEAREHGKSHASRHHRG